MIQLDEDTKENEVIENNQKWFNFALYVPIMGAVMAIIGVIFAWIFEPDAMAAGVYFITLISLPVAIYILLKLSWSYKILHIYYLRRIYKKLYENKKDFLVVGKKNLFDGKRVAEQNMIPKQEIEKNILTSMKSIYNNSPKKQEEDEVFITDEEWLR